MVARVPFPSQDVDPHMLVIRCYIGGGESIKGRSCGEREQKILRDMRHAPFLDREPAGTKIHPLMVATGRRWKTEKGRATEQRSYMTTKIVRSHLHRRCHLPPVAGTFDVQSIYKVYSNLRSLSWANCRIYFTARVDESFATCRTCGTSAV